MAEQPTKLGKYVIRSHIASGSMGTVYLGHDSFINREVAIKVAQVDALQDPAKADMYRKMFFNEAHTAGMLNHPNILAVYDAGVDENHYYIVMEYVKGGRTLRDLIKATELPTVDKTAEIIFKCAKALNYAHGKGVIHRDIKPSNILLTDDGDVKIADFSIAFIAHPDMTLTQPMGLVGSPLYMSPEQVQEDTLNNQTDIFSLGVIMYELLTGTHPFRADNFSKLVYRIAHETPAPAHNFRSDIPRSISNIVRKAIDKDRNIRYHTGLDLATDLSRAFSGLERPSAEVSSKEKFTAIRELRFFRSFPENEIWEVLGAGIWATYTPGEQILTEGDIDDAFYIMVDGNVKVVKSGKSIGELNKGDCFGEMGYITKAKRTASIVATTPVSLLKINSTLIDQTSPSCQLHFHKIFLRTLIERLSLTTERLSQLENHA